MRAAALDSIHEQETLNRRYDAAGFSGDISCSYTLAPVEVFIRRLDVTLKGES